MNEHPELFGANGHLVGMATAPTAGPTSDVACLMLNFGVTQRIGPHRINVKLARQLARQGVPSFRFDLSGVGDSARATAAVDHRQQAVADIKAAMDHCEAMWGLKKFAVLGLCSGSVNGYAVSLEDPRVVALLIFDAFAFRTRASDLTRAWRRLLAMPRNPAVLDKAVRWVKRYTHNGTAPIDIFAAKQRRLDHGEFERAVNSLVERRVALFFIYTGTLHSVDKGHAQLGQLRHASFLKHVRYEFMADVDHTVTSLAAQQRVLDAACGWMADVVSGKAQPRLDDRPPAPRREGSAVKSPDSAMHRVLA